MKIKNTNKGFPTENIRMVVGWINRRGVSINEIWVKGSRSWRARVYMGARYIVVRLNPELKYPIELKGGKGYLPFVLYSKYEFLVYMLAHEIRHLYQKQNPGYRKVWGARGKISERDADAFAIKEVRRWRMRYGYELRARG